MIRNMREEVLKELDRNRDITAMTGTVFNKRQLDILEKEFGTWADVGKSIHSDVTTGELNRLAGRQDVLDFIRRLIG